MVGKNVLLAAAGNTFFLQFSMILMEFKWFFPDLLMIFGRFFHDFFMICSWSFYDLNVRTRSQPTPNLLCFFLMYWRFFVDFLLIDFLSSEGRSPEARRRSHAEVAGKAVSFLLRIPYIFQNFPLLSFYSPRFPFLLLQVSRFCLWLQREAHFRGFSSRVSG